MYACCFGTQKKARMREVAYGWALGPSNHPHWVVSFSFSSSLPIAVPQAQRGGDLDATANVKRLDHMQLPRTSAGDSGCEDLDLDPGI